MAGEASRENGRDSDRRDEADQLPDNEGGGGAAYRLMLLGGAGLLRTDGGDPPPGASQPRRLAILAVLADAWPAAVTRDRLIGLIWPEQDTAGARRLLTQALYVIRRELGEDALRTTTLDVTLMPAVLPADLLALREALRAGDTEGAFAHYRGPFLQGFHLGNAPAVERWCDDVRDSLSASLSQAARHAARTASNAGDHAESRRWYERLVQLLPFDAPVVMGLVETTVLSGDPAAALAHVHAYERRMRDDLDVDPDPQVRSVLDALRGRPAALPAAISAASPTGTSPTGTSPSDTTFSNEAASGSAQPMHPDEAPPATPPETAATRVVPASRGIATGRNIAAAASLLLLMGAGALWKGRTATPPTQLAAVPRDVVLLPLIVRGDSAEAAKVREIVTDGLLALQGANGRTVRVATGGDTVPVAEGSAVERISGTVVVTAGNVRVDLAVPGAATPVTRRSSRDSLLALTDQLTCAVLVELYPELGRSLRDGPARTTSHPKALRRHLDGEVRLRQGDFPGAWDAFREATELDPGFSTAWYRRAIAAEYTQRTQDADSAILQALRRPERLPERDRLLYTGYAQWRTGNAVFAESYFRDLAGRSRFDQDVWFQLAEVLYHAGPLLGRPMENATDAWRAVIAIDSANFEAIIHAVRLEARAGNASGLAALQRRLALLRASGPVAGESRVFAAYGSRSDAQIAAIEPLLDSLPDYSLFYLHAMIAGMLEKPEAAEHIARKLTASGRPQTIRAQGFLALAHLAVARGRTGEAAGWLAQAEPLDPVSAAWTRANFATLPWMTTDRGTRDSIAGQITVMRTGVASAVPLSLELAVDIPASPLISAYHLALLAGPEAAAPGRLACDPTWIPRVRSLCADLQRGLRVSWAQQHASGDARDLDDFVPRVPYQFAGRSTYFSRTRERWWRAVSLEAQRKDQEADMAFRSIHQSARLDYIYFAPSLWHRGRIAERRGDAAEARRLYAHVLELYDRPDADARALADSARAGISRLGVTK